MMRTFFSHCTFLIISLLTSLLFSCQSNSCRPAPDVSTTEVDLEFVRWDEALFQAQNKQDIENLLQQYPDFSQQYLHLSDYPSDSVLADQYYQLITNPSIDTLYQQTQAVFGDLSSLREEFEQAFRLVKYYYPAFSPPTVYTAFTGLGTTGDDLLVNDSMIVVSLEFFTGSSASYRPQTHDYILTRYRPQFIVPSCMLLLSNKFNVTDLNDQSLLAEIIFYGKSYYFVQQMMPCLADSTLFGYTSPQATTVDENRKLIWSHFVDNELLFKNDQTTKTRYLGDRPSTVEINGKIPGQIGRWLGWQIVQAYADKTNTPLPQLMQDKQAQEIFRQATYRP